MESTNVYRFSIFEACQTHELRRGSIIVESQILSIPKIQPKNYHIPWKFMLGRWNFLWNGSIFGDIPSFSGHNLQAISWQCPFHGDTPAAQNHDHDYKRLFPSPCHYLQIPGLKYKCHFGGGEVVVDIPKKTNSSVYFHWQIFFQKYAQTLNFKTKATSRCKVSK